MTWDSRPTSSTGRDFSFFRSVHVECQSTPVVFTKGRPSGMAEHLSVDITVAACSTTTIEFICSPDAFIWSIADSGVSIDRRLAGPSRYRGFRDGSRLG